MGKGNMKCEEVLFIVGLRHNLLSINQICDKGNDVIFIRYGYEIRRSKSGHLVETGIKIINNLYTLTITLEGSCLLGQANTTQLWHKGIGHINFESLAKISTKEAVRYMPRIYKLSNNICSSYQKVKQIKTSFKAKEHHFGKSLELIHVDLCGPTRTQSINSHKYFMLIIDDYSRMIWAHFFKYKSKAFDMFVSFKNMIENQTGRRIKYLRSNRGGEFIYEEFEKYYEKHGIRR